MSELTDEDRASLLWHGLSNCFHINKKMTIDTVIHWLEYHRSGIPDVPFERIRDEARFWAAASHQVELEAYMVACILEIEKTALAARATKRLAALAYKAMSEDDQEKFKEWISK